MSERFIKKIVLLCLFVSTCVVAAWAEEDSESGAGSTVVQSISIEAIQSDKALEAQAQWMLSELREKSVRFSKYQVLLADKQKTTDFYLRGHLIKVDAYKPYAIMLELQLRDMNGQLQKKWLLDADMSERKFAARYKRRSKTSKEFFSSVLEDFVKCELSRDADSCRKSTIFLKLGDFFKRISFQDD